ncbi:MAG: tRNA (guanosine(46)-N7)-methyltransferase TrmB [Bacteroidota bacterium]
MAKNKLKRFSDMKLWSNCFEPTMDAITLNNFPLKGKWAKEYFKNDNPIVLELGCGKGEYSIGLSQHFPDKNFIGVDIKGARIWVGAKEAIEKEYKNVAFLRTKVDFISSFFEQNEVDEIWLTFSDPQPIKPNKRLTSTYFIENYRKILKAGGIIHLKTDSDVLFESTLNEIEEHKYMLLESTWDLYGEMSQDLDQTTKDIFHIKTHYEKLFVSKGSVIKYCKFKIS